MISSSVLRRGYVLCSRINQSLSPEDSPIKQMIQDEADTILLGLRVYTRQAPVSISGQLRHGQLLRWKKSVP